MFNLYPGTQDSPEARYLDLQIIFPHRTSCWVYGHRGSNHMTARFWIGWRGSRNQLHKSRTKQGLLASPNERRSGAGAEVTESCLPPTCYFFIRRIVLQSLKGQSQRWSGKTDGLVVLPYMCRVCYNLKKAASRRGISVVSFSSKRACMPSPSAGLKKHSQIRTQSRECTKCHCTLFVDWVSNVV